jgi:hypothetical protein
LLWGNALVETAQIVIPTAFKTVKIICTKRKLAEFRGVVLYVDAYA